VRAEGEHAWYDRPDPTGLTDSGEVGLRFRCTQCGNCCTGAPGYVRFEPHEARAMAHELGIDERTFRERYAHETHGGVSLREVETRHGFDCVLLDRESEPGKALCRVYQSRPSQCRTWPFWPENVRTKQAWLRAARECPGMNSGPLAPPGAIRLTVSATAGDPKRA